MYSKKSAFTLVEVLISITLLSLVLMALYKSSDLLRRSNKHLYHHLEHITDGIEGSQALYLDLLQSDGNITIERKEKNFDRLIIEHSAHSLYGLSYVKVVWLVYKENNTLLRVEGSRYKLPLLEDDRVEIDEISSGEKLFKIYHGKMSEKFLVIMQDGANKPQSFLVQNVSLVHKKIEMVRPGDIGRPDKKKKK